MCVCALVCASVTQLGLHRALCRSNLPPLCMAVNCESRHGLCMPLAGLGTCPLQTFQEQNIKGKAGVWLSLPAPSVDSTLGNTPLLLHPMSDRKGSTGSKGFLSPRALQLWWLALTLGTHLMMLGLTFWDAVTWSGHSLGKRLPECRGGRGWHLSGETQLYCFTFLFLFLAMHLHGGHCQAE